MELLKKLVGESKKVVAFCADKCKVHGFKEIRAITIDKTLTMRIYEVVPHATPNGEKLMSKWNAIWRKGFSKEYTTSTISFNTVFSLELNGSIIGVCGYNKYDNVVHLHSLATDRKGYSRVFCQTFLEYSKTQGDYLLAGVTVESPKWISEFYQTLGFSYIDNSDPRFECCLEYKYPRLFSAVPLIWMYQSSH